MTPDRCPCCRREATGLTSTHSLRRLCDPCYQKQVRMMTCWHEVKEREEAAA